MTPAPTADRSVLLRRGNLAPLALVNLGVGMHAMIWFMASTVMPSTVKDLDAAAFISWATSVYLVAMILGAVVMAPAKARFGARQAMLGAGLTVALGGLVCAVAPSITLVLAGRVLQGLGEGVLVALSYALVRELFDNALVPRVFGTQALTWGITIFLGPALGGWLTEMWSWRVAFIGAALLPIPLLLIGWRILRAQDHVATVRHGAPLVRLFLLLLGVMAITAADRLQPAWLGPVCVVAGLALIGAVLMIDKRRAPHLFPTAFPGLSHPASLGLWVMLLMPLSHAPIYVYGPYILQLHRGLSPTMAGYFGAIHAMAWSVTAVAIASLSVRWHDSAIRTGPALLSLGLAGVALSIAAQPLPLVAVALVLVGVAFGICNLFITQRVLGAAQSGQEDETAGAIAMLPGLGGAISAALAGLAGNRVGLDGVLTMDVVSRAALALFGGGALLSLLAFFMALRLLRVGARPAVHPPKVPVPTP